ncbi:hypothetical protein ACFO5K_18765 [Nocardia halotolerans]|uniref:Uncharacterized protein n=1 Tax=Nocardia halotolerans TaxID=1755878 RepID=A0ABV8VNJ8_9NOCA
MSWPRTRRLLAVAVWLAALYGACLGCANFALSTGGPLEQAAAETSSQVQTLRLAAVAGVSDPAPTVMLGVVIDDADTALAEAATKVVRVSPEQPRRAELLALIDRARELLPEQRAALDTSDDDALRRIRDQLSALSGDLDRWRRE